jgi:hypothetical protein
VSAGKPVVGFLRDGIGGGVPSLEPAVIVARLDAARDGQHLSDLAAAIFVSRDDAQRLESKVRIVRKQKRLTL